MIAALKPSERLPTHVVSVAKFERFFRTAAGLEVDKQDLKRYSDFVNRKIYDLLLCGEETAKANGRRVIQAVDLSITKGLRESIREFKIVDEQVGLAPILDRITARPPLDMTYSGETEALLPELVGGLSIALARLFKIVDPDLKNPHAESWERAFRIFDLLQ